MKSKFFCHDFTPLGSEFNLPSYAFSSYFLLFTLNHSSNKTYSVNKESKRNTQQSRTPMLWSSSSF